jgi:hypothetical protein
VSLSNLQTPSSQTSQRFDQAGGLAYEARIERLNVLRGQRRPR